MKILTRREILQSAATASTGWLLRQPAAGQSAASDKIRVVVAGGHPDDPETGCGGTMARYAEQGHEVVVLYLTRGEAGIKGKSHDEAAAIRTREAMKACEQASA